MGLAVGAGAQTVTAVSVPGVPLLPRSFGEWKQQPGDGLVPAYSLSKVNQDALEEDGPQRSAVADYARGGKTVHIEAVQFGDRTGAFSAFTLVERPGTREGKELGELDAAGDGSVLFMQGATLVLVNGAVELASLKPLADGLPKVFGSKAVAPVLPTILPVKALVSGSMRYAVGPASYKAQGGVLPSNSVGWEKSAEAVTAQYDGAGADRRSWEREGAARGCGGRPGDGEFWRGGRAEARRERPPEATGGDGQGAGADPA